MAMLMTNEVFARTWGERAGPAPQAEYWPTLIERTKAVHPDFLFIAEAYWDMEWTLQQQGFDLCYDKRLYDRLAHESAESVRGHLQADPGYQERLLRFIENHDEPRAAATFEPAQARAAAVAMSTLQGARLYHDGQLDGRRTRIPVFLGRGPDEPPDGDLRAFYARLLRAVDDADLRDGDVARCANATAGRTTTPGASSSPGAGRARAHGTWWSSTSPMRPAQARVRLPWDDLAGPRLGADRPAGRARASSATATSSPQAGLYVALDRGHRTSSPSSADGPTPSTPRPSRRARSSAARPPHASVLGTPERTGPRRSGSGAGRPECGALTAPGRPPRGA